MSLKIKLLNIFTCGIYGKLIKILIKLNAQQDSINYLSYKNDFNNNYSINYFNNIDFDKRFMYEKLKDTNKKSLLVIARFNQNGGIEKRQTIMLKYLEKYYNIFILSHVNTFNYSSLLSNKNYFIYLTNIIDSSEEILEQYIRKIISYHNVDYTEIHFGPLLTLNYRNLKTGNVKLIGHMHSSLSFYNKGYKHFDEAAVNHILSNINSFDAIIKVKHNDIDINYTNTHIIQNGIEEICDIYKVNNSNKCLIVSRIDEDKLISVQSILSFASMNNIDVDIAGVSSNSYSYEKIKQEVEQKFSNIKINFIGYIETTKYLKENFDKYLFVSGLGQVILEGISLGFPCLQGETLNNKLSFITKENYLELYNKNFSKLEENSITLNQDLISIKNGNIKDFQLGKEREEMLISKLVDKYKSILDFLDKKD